ncbi:ATP-dependent protease La [Haemophilus influenzae]|uniref:ATP-dependent protease La n=1 Tax=Haemophilus influenzae TaxID=727 RepID=A0A2X1PNZ2_HAEIF|nr:ATP-dependent protease La [Haemophilus influenzae]
MAAHLPVSIRHKQNALELANVQERLEYLLGMMEAEADILQVEKTHSWSCQKTNGEKPA